ncbi:MAG: hypothetical protein WCD42_09015, partial [Rhizomicrobium sp.]
YQCQNEAIALWPDQIAGWKIGKIPDALQAKFGCHRLAGPIFTRNVFQNDGASETACGVFVGGTACFEAEFVFEVDHDADPAKLSYSIADADALAGRLYVGVEMAGSPLADINARGPHIVVADFGNNADEIIGQEIADWRKCKWEDLTVESFIDGVLVGSGSAANVPGGPLESLQFIAENCARRGLALKKGQLISTGAATGVHDIVTGQKAKAVFAGIETIAVSTHPRRAISVA